MSNRSSAALTRIDEKHKARTIVRMRPKMILMTGRWLRERWRRARADAEDGSRRLSATPTRCETQGKRVRRGYKGAEHEKVPRSLQGANVRV